MRASTLRLFACACLAVSLWGQQPQPAAAPSPAPAQQPAAAAQPEPAAAQPAPAQPVKTQPVAAPAGGFVLNVQNASLIEIIDILARGLHINYILDPRVQGTVTLNTYGEIKEVDRRSLMETILRINNAAMVQVGDLYRIVPIADVARLPVKPEVDPKAYPDDEHMMLNMVFLKYATVNELVKLIEPFLGEGARAVSYEPANLLMILDNTRSMKRTMDLIAMFDSDVLARQRVRLFEVKNGRPSDLAKDLESVLSAVSLGGKASAARFLPMDRINTIVAIAPNPGVFDQIEEWLKKLDIPIKTTKGTSDNYVYRVKYGRAESLAMAIMQLYFGFLYGFGGMYGGMGGGMYGGGMYGGMGGGMYGGGGGYGAGAGGFGGNAYGGGMAGAGMYGGGMYGGGMYPGMYGGGGYGGGIGGAVPATRTGTSGTGATGTAAGDQTGSYLGAGTTGMPDMSNLPRVIPNPFDNTLLMHASPQDYEQILRLLEQLDVAPRQVLVEARIYEVNLQGAFASGVQAALTRRDAGTPSGFNASRTLQGIASGGGVALSAGMLVGQSRQLLAMLSASESNQRAKLISAPRLIATDSIAASISVGDEVPTVTGQAVAGGLQSSGSSLFTQSIASRQTGVSLNVLARVNPSGIITLIINQQVSAPVAPPADVATPSSTPSFSNRNVSTQVTVQDGDMIAIAGIMNESETYSSAGIPLLHRIPVIGAAFGNKTMSKQRTELVIFFTPRIIYDTNQIVEASDELKSGFKHLNKLMQQ